MAYIFRRLGRESHAGSNGHGVDQRVASKVAAMPAAAADCGGERIRERFERLVLPHLDALFAMSFQLTGDQTRAGELCQETALRAYGALSDLTISERRIRVWLLTILYRAFRSGTANHQGAVAPTIGSSKERIENHTSGDVDVATPWPGDSAGLEIQRVLRGMPQDDKEAILLTHLAQLSYEEAAETLEVPVEAVRARVSRGRAFMRTALKHQAR